MVGDDSGAPGGGVRSGVPCHPFRPAPVSEFLVLGTDQAVPDPSPRPPLPREFKRSRKVVQKESIWEWKMSGDE